MFEEIIAAAADYEQSSRTQTASIRRSAYRAKRQLPGRSSVWLGHGCEA
jgi:hypothetical protein